MSSQQTFLRRLGVLGLVLLASGCTQRTAPVDLSTATPQPRAVFEAPPVFETPPQAVRRPVARTPVQVRPPVQAQSPVQARPSPVRPFPQISSDLPPPNTNPVVADVGSTPARTPLPRNRRPLPPVADDPAALIEDNPYQSFDPIRPPARDPQTIVEQSLEASEQRRPVGYTPPQRQASDDYTTVIGDNGFNPARRDSAGPNAGAEQRQQTAGFARPAPSAPTDLQSNRPAAAPLPGGKALVALLVPETDRRGSVRAVADSLAKAASLAATDIGEPQLELRKYDTGGDPRKAAEAAKNAIADGARLIIGPLFSGSAAAVRPIAQAANVSVIAFTTDQTVLGGGLYSIGFLPETDVNRMISYAAARGQRDIALLIPDTPFGGIVARSANNAAAQTGSKIVKVQPFKEDFRALDAAAKEFAAYYESAPNVDAIIMATNGKSLQGLASFLAFRDVLPTKVKYLGLGLWDDKETFREGTLRGAWFPGVDPILKNDFAFRYGKAYGSEAPAIALLGYDSVSVAAALIRSGSFSQQALLSPSGFTGLSGLFRFRRDGRNERALSILSVGPRSFSVVDPAPRSFSTQVSSLTGG